MPRYEFRCRECSSTFEVDRPIKEAGSPADCPAGHGDTVKLISTVAIGGRGGAAVSMGREASMRAAAAERPRGGGCCGGACGCG